MNEHNPISVRIDEMIHVWRDKVQPQHTLVRWMLKPEEARMYEGFCRLESSQYGKLDNLFVFFYTPFESAKTFSLELMENWLREYDDAKNQKLIAKAGLTSPWEVQPFREAVNEKNYAACDQLLHAMIQSYKKWLNRPQLSFVFALLPKQLSGIQAYLDWQYSWMEHVQPGTQLLVFDHVEGNYWGEIFEKFNGQAVTLQHDLRMQEAIRQISTAGAATDPYAFFRKCMFEMGDASVKKNQALLNQWGERGVECGKKTGDKSLLATAYITWAGMLFGFKDHQKINELLDTGIRLCKQELPRGNDAMKPLLIQFYLYKGADMQLQKERKEALQWFIKAGDEAVQMDYIVQAVSAYHKAFVFADYRNWQEDKLVASEKALQLTSRLSDDEIKSSEYAYIAYDYVQLKQDTPNELMQIAEEKMINAYGTDWQKTVEELKVNYTKKKLRQAEEGSLAMTAGE